MDFTSVKYNSTTGTQLQVQRQANTGNAKDVVTAQTKDAFGNIYITGSNSLLAIFILHHRIIFLQIWEFHFGFSESQIGLPHFVLKDNVCCPAALAV